MIIDQLFTRPLFESRTDDITQFASNKEGTESQLSTEQLATISDAALDDAYHYGRSSPGNTFGWQANLKSAEFAAKLINAGETDIEKISDAIHQGWNTTARAFVSNAEQFDDTEKLRAAGKLEGKLAQRQKLMNISYAQLPDDEQEKDRVVARALLQAITGSSEQGMDERIGDLGKFSHKKNRFKSLRKLQNPLGEEDAIDPSRRGFLKKAAGAAVAGAAMSAAGPEIVTLVKGFAEQAGGMNGIQALKAMLKVATADELYNMYDYYSDSGILADAITDSDMRALQRVKGFRDYEDWSDFEEYCEDNNDVNPVEEFERLTGQSLKVKLVDDIVGQIDDTWSLENFFDEHPDALKLINPFDDGSISRPTMQQLAHIDKEAKGASLPAPIVAMANAVSGLVRQIFKSNGQPLAAPQQSAVQHARHTPALPAPTRPEFDITPDLKQKEKVPVQRKGDDEEQGVAEGSDRVDSLVTDALKIMRGPEMSDAVLALKRVLGDRAYNERRGFYSFYVDKIHHMYGQRGMAENNHWHAAGVADAQRDVKRDPNRKVKTLNPRTRLKTMQDKQARHPEEVEQYSQGYRSVKQGVAESNTLMKKLHQALLKEGRVKELADDLKTLNDAEFMKKYGKAKAAIRKDMKKVDEGNANSGRRGPNSPPDNTPVKLGRVQKLKTGIKHHADSSRYGGTVPDTDDDHLLSPASRHRLHKAVTPGQQDLDEGNMPQSVIKSKQKYADMSDQEFHAAHKNKSEDDLKSMAWRHGYGKGSNHYVNRHKKGGGQLNELSTNKLAQYKTAAAADAKKADQSGDVKRGDKRFGGIVKATKKQFDNDAKKIDESRRDRQALMAQIANGR